MEITDKLPLEGIRVVDFTFAWAGPYATMLLAFMGAEIIKIESAKRLDHSRIISLTTAQVFSDPDISPVFNDMNLSKLNVNLDLKQPKAVELAKKIIEKSDVVIENMRPGVMKKLGLGYKIVREVKPDIVYLSSSARGSNGPEANYIGYAPSFGALSGLSEITGYSEGLPTMMMGEIDLISATTSAFAILAALDYRQRTGEGQYIDLSSSETSSVLIGEVFMDYFMNQKVHVRNGNKDDIMAPHNGYPCKGKNRWISIAIATEEEWISFCDAVGNPDWTKEERFSDANSRWNNQDDLDKLISEWTINYEPFEVMEILQNVGVAAVPYYNSKDLFSDPHLEERGFSTKVDHPKIGERVVIKPPWKYSTIPFNIRSGPLFGEHNNYVFGEILKMPEDEILKLIEEKVIY